MFTARRWLCSVTAALALVCVPGALFSGPVGYEPGATFLEFRLRAPLYFQGTAYESTENVYGFASQTTVLYGTSDQRRNAALIQNTAVDPELRGFGYGMAGEYAWSRWLGLGISLENAAYDLQNARALAPDSDEYATALLVLATRPAETAAAQDFVQQLILAETYEPFSTETQRVANVTTLNLEPTVHLLQGYWLDPYVRGAVGIGRERKQHIFVFRFGLSAGVRLFLGRVYLDSNLGVSRYYFPGGESHRSRPAFEGQLDEVYWTAAVGLRL